MNPMMSVVALAAGAGLGALVACAQITVPTVTIGNPGNAPDPLTGSLYGSVAYTYNIGAYEVTNAQYAAFLNAKAAADPFGLYNTLMASSIGGITRSGQPESYEYQAVAGRAEYPVNYVSFWDAARFVNWLHNGQGNGDTETGAYTLTPESMSANSVTRIAGWQWAIANEDEWYKAAYHQPASQGGDTDDYWLYPTSSNTITIADANYGDSNAFFTPAGSYAPNFYGVFDMGGNAWERNESTFSTTNRGLRGGSFNGTFGGLRSTNRASVVLTNENFTNGFRVVQAVASVCAACAADFDMNGGVEGGDVAAFFVEFEMGGACADVDQNGGVDGGDVAAFFAVYEAGGC